jgi:aryl-phospho-beta-D-glucosidase BglC (GH1 family)
MVHNAGMKAIINIHHDGNYTEPPNTWGFLKFAEVGRGAADNEQVKDQLSKVWTQIANYFKNYGDDLIFETMNEVHSGNWGNGVSNTEQDRLFDWNKTALDAIRATGDNNAKRFVAVPTLGSTEPGMVIAAHNRNKLLPSDLGNGTSRLIVSVHFYAPWQYTVADVTGQGGEGRNTITTAELNAIDTEAARIKSTFINNGIAVYYGEWGAPTNVRATMSETIKSTHINYIGRVASATKANGIVPIIWDDGGDFKMLERSNGTPKTGLWKDVRDAYINATGTTSSGSSSSGSSSSSSSSGGGGTGNYCNYGICTTGWDEWTCIGGGGCYPMPTDDYCASGTLVVSCPAGSVPPMGSW